MANVGLPGTAGFVGEFLSLLGAFEANSWVALIATSGVVFSAAYALYLYRRVVFGALEKANLKDIADLTPREIAIFTPLVLLTIYYGVQPDPILNTTAASVDHLLQSHTALLDAVKFAAASR
jgi:NADH-quinone oxidoreductase subunit M